MVDGRKGIEFGLCFHPATEVTVRMHQLTKKGANGATICKAFCDAKMTAIIIFGGGQG